MTIIPSSRKMTFQSMPNRSELNASRASTIWNRSISPAPASATTTRWTHSVAISVYAPTKTTIAMTSFIELATDG